MRLDFGLTGMPGSGKTTSADYLEERYGFIQFSGSDYLLDEARKIDLTLNTRADFMEFYRQQRLIKGANFIAKQSLETPGDRVLNVGIRTDADVDYFLAAGGILIGVLCDVDNRFHRTAGTGAKYPRDLAAFKQADALDNLNDDTGMYVDYALQYATHRVDNNDGLQELYFQLDDIFDQYRYGQQR